MGESENMSSKQSSEISSHNSNQSIDNDCTQNVTFHHSTYDSDENMKHHYIKDDLIPNNSFKNNGIILHDSLVCISTNSNDVNKEISVKPSDSDNSKEWQNRYSSSTRMLSPPRKEPIDVDDDENSSSDDEWDKVPRVGSEYQVDNIPLVCRQSPDYDEGTDELLWDPKRIQENEVENYLTTVNELVAPSHPSTSKLHIRDNEDALLLLRQCDNDVAEALRRVRFRPPPLTSELCVWSKEECRQFEHGLTLYGKDFHTIHHNKVKTKSVGEIVKFYYVWKKSQHPVKTRLGKKKEATQSTDYVEKLMDETELSKPSSRPPARTDLFNLSTVSVNRSLIQSSFTDYSGFSELARDDEFLGDGILDHINPTLPADTNYLPGSLSELDPVIFVAYSDPGHFSPIASTTTHREVPVASANFNDDCHVSPSHRSDLSSSVPYSSPDSCQSQSSTNCDTSNITLPQDVLLSIHQLESTRCSSSDSDSAGIQVSKNTLLPTFSSDSDPCSPYQITSVNEVNAQSEAVISSGAAKRSRHSHLENEILSPSSSSNHNANQSAKRITEVAGKLVC